MTDFPTKTIDRTPWLDQLQQEKQHLEQLSQQVQTLTTLDIQLLQRGKYQPRRQFTDEELHELALSIQQHGVMQPIIVRPVQQQGRPYEIIAGERRWRAAQLAGLTHIPAIIRQIDDHVAMALALIENIQRQDLNPIEQAMALQRFQDEFKMSHQDIAKTIGKARVTVTNLLRLLSLHDDVKQLIQKNQLDMGHARALLGLKKIDQPHVAQEIINKGLTVRKTEQRVREFYTTKTVKKHTLASPDLERLVQNLSEHFNTHVSLEHNTTGQGKLVIHYYSLDELDGVLNICGVDTNQL